MTDPTTIFIAGMLFGTLLMGSLTFAYVRYLQNLVGQKNTEIGMMKHHWTPDSQIESYKEPKVEIDEDVLEKLAGEMREVYEEPEILEGEERDT